MSSLKIKRENNKLQSNNSIHIVQGDAIPNLGLKVNEFVTTPKSPINYQSSKKFLKLFSKFQKNFKEKFSMHQGAKCKFLLKGNETITKREFSRSKIQMESKEEKKDGGVKEVTKHKISVDYTQPLEKMIQAGNLQWADPKITDEHFPINRRPNGELEVQLIQLDKEKGSAEALVGLSAKGLRPVELPELLALAAAYPEEQKKGPVVALGSQWQYPKGGLLVSYLWSDAITGERTLNLVGSYRNWGSFYRFAAVRIEEKQGEAQKK